MGMFSDLQKVKEEEAKQKTQKAHQPARKPRINTEAVADDLKATALKNELHDSALFRKEDTAKKSRHQGTLEPRKQGSLDTKTDPTPDKNENDSLFDINQRPDKSNTYEFTREELWAIEDLKNDLEREHDMEVTKYDIVRCAVHCLVEDYKRQGRNSFAFRRLQTKKPR